MPNVRELEDLVIDAIYLDILRGKLDQKEGQLEVEYTMGRDLEPGKLESILSTLQDWCGDFFNPRGKYWSELQVRDYVVRPCRAGRENCPDNQRGQ